jgi:hypothetical protein
MLQERNCEGRTKQWISNLDETAIREAHGRDAVTNSCEGRNRLVQDGMKRRKLIPGLAGTAQADVAMATGDNRARPLLCQRRKSKHVHEHNDLVAALQLHVCSLPAVKTPSRTL